MIRSEHFLLLILILSVAESLWPWYSISWKSYFQNHLQNFSLGLFSFWMVQVVYSWIAKEPSVLKADSSSLEPVRLVLGLFAVDFSSWAWHWLNHQFSIFWRSHRVHHSDLALISSSSIRFHPFEVIPGNSIRLLVAWTLSLSSSELGIVQFIYFAQNVIQHSNLVFPERLEKILSWVLITPRMHHLHHSIESKEQRCNLGTIFSFWDHFLGTFKWPAGRRINFGIDNEQVVPTLKSIFLQPIQK